MQPSTDSLLRWMYAIFTILYVFCFQTQDGEGNLEASATMCNILGNAEQLQAHMSFGHKTVSHA